MSKRIDAQGYKYLDEFEADFNLIIENCMKYNGKDSFFYRAAVRLRDQGGAVLRKTRRDVQTIGFDFQTGMHLLEQPKIEPSAPFSWEDGKCTNLLVTQGTHFFFCPPATVTICACGNLS